MDAKFLVLFSLITLVGIVSCADLYANNAHEISELKQKNFEDAIYCKGNKNCVSCVVQFYNGSSSISKTYQTTYLQMAANISEWKLLVKLAAVNCDDPQNSELCQLHNFDFVPIVRYFRSHETHKISDSSNFVYTGEEMKAFFDPQSMVEQLGRFILEDYAENNYSDWPKFINFTDTARNATEVWEQEVDPCVNKILFVIVKSLDTDLSDFIALHYRYKEKFPKYRITRDHPLAKLIKTEHLSDAKMMLLTKPGPKPDICKIQSQEIDQLNLEKVFSKLGVPFSQRDTVLIIDEDDNSIEYSAEHHF